MGPPRSPVETPGPKDLRGDSRGEFGCPRGIRIREVRCPTSVLLKHVQAYSSASDPPIPPQTPSQKVLEFEGFSPLDPCMGAFTVNSQNAATQLSRWPGKS